ncbi:hypothetical protein SCUCBS95973_005650 [Sporothrix curviconia]|uniref:Uncharacterized protein n=1 Tax=Sporothrix curviconia TaxID=1260050 RepID=A0ABP0BZ15_9PEZI
MDEKQAFPELSQAVLPSQEDQVPANSPTRKQQRDSDDDDAEPQVKRARTTNPTSEPAPLTRKNLALFNKMVKKKTADPSDDGSTTTLPTTASGFDARALKNGVIAPMDSRPPENLEELRERLAAPRKSASPPVSVYEDYVYAVEGAVNEATMFLIKSKSLVNSHEEYKEGRRGLRNAQDHAREQSYALKDQLKEHYKQQRSSGLHPVAEVGPSMPVPGIGPLDGCEGKGDYDVVESHPVYQPTPPTSSKPKHSQSHHSHSTPHSSKVRPSTHGSTTSGQKRKAPSSQGSSSDSSHRSKYKRYWKKDWH